MLFPDIFTVTDSQVSESTIMSALVDLAQILTPSSCVYLNEKCQGPGFGCALPDVNNNYQASLFKTIAWPVFL